MTAIDALKQRTAEAVTLTTTAAVLEWDQQTQMPPAGAQRRASQIALVQKLAHDTLVSTETEQLLKRAEAESTGLDPDSDDAAYQRVTRRDFDKASKIPSKLVEEIASTSVLAHQEWAKARAASNYALFAPWLEKILDLERQVTDCLGYKNERYDALLDKYEPDMTAAEVRTMFESLKPVVVDLDMRIAEQPAIDTEPLTRDFDEDKQRAFGESIIKLFGYDFFRGRQERAVHPFCTAFSRDDVRITTRFDRNFLPMALFGTLHETGHALYI